MDNLPLIKNKQQEVSFIETFNRLQYLVKLSILLGWSILSKLITQIAYPWNFEVDFCWRKSNCLKDGKLKAKNIRYRNTKMKFYNRKLN